MNKIHTIWLSGLVLSIVMAFIAYFGFANCKQDIGCLVFVIIPGYPGLILGLEGLTSIIVSLIFWFLLGALIGFLIYKIKKK